MTFLLFCELVPVLPLGLIPEWLIKTFLIPFNWNALKRSTSHFDLHRPRIVSILAVPLEKSKSGDWINNPHLCLRYFTRLVKWDCERNRCQKSPNYKIPTPPQPPFKHEGCPFFMPLCGETIKLEPSMYYFKLCVQSWGTTDSGQLFQTRPGTAWGLHTHSSVLWASIPSVIPTTWNTCLAVLLKSIKVS